MALATSSACRSLRRMSSCNSSVVAASISSRSLCSTVVAPLIPRQYINGLTSFFPLVYLLCSSQCQGLVCRVPDGDCQPAVLSFIFDGGSEYIFSLLPPDHFP